MTKEEIRLILITLEYLMSQIEIKTPTHLSLTESINKIIMKDYELNEYYYGENIK